MNVCIVITIAMVVKLLNYLWLCKACVAYKQLVR